LLFFSLAFLKLIYKVLFSFLKVLAFRLASNSPLTILLHQFFFPLQQSFPFQKPPTSKSQKSKSKSLKQKLPKQETSHPPSRSLLYPVVKQGGTAVLREGCDIVTEETCIPASLNLNNLGEAGVLRFPLLWPELCLSWSTDTHFRKSC
jgi:hypothetical protein